MFSIIRGGPGNGRSVDYLAHCTVGEVIDVLPKLEFAMSRFCNESNGMRTLLEPSGNQRGTKPNCNPLLSKTNRKHTKVL